MKKLTIVMLSLILALVLNACEEIGDMIPSGNTQAQDEIVTQTGEENETSVIVTPGVEGSQTSVTLGEVLVLKIPTIPQKGFEWVVQDLDTNILVQEGESLYKENTGPDSADSAAILRFRAVGIGETSLNLAYVNTSDEGTGLSQQTFGMKVTVRPSGEIVAVRPEIQGNSVSINLGDTLVVEIPTIPTEGFQWAVIKIDNTILVQEGEADYVRDTRSADATGGITYLTFKTVGPGETHLSMEYANSPAEGPSLSQHTFGLQVTVKDPSQGNVVVTPPIDGHTFTINLNDTLIFEIPTTLTEGFEWVVEDLNPNILVQEGSATFKEEPDDTGTTSKVILEFKAVGRGTTSLSLAYRNEVSGDTGDFTLMVNTFNMTVEVQ